jgi:hypothetical protein
MSAMKDNLIQAAELLGMDPGDLLNKLDPQTQQLSTADALLAAARQCADEGLEGHALRRYRKLDDLLSAGGAPPEAWREGPDAPDLPLTDAIGELFDGAERTGTDLCSTLDLTHEVFTVLQTAAGPRAYVGNVYPAWHPKAQR